MPLRRLLATGLLLSATLPLVARAQQQPMVLRTVQPSQAGNQSLPYHPVTGQRSPLRKDWVGMRAVSRDIPILVMAGHADSQGIGGSGTSGEAVALYSYPPMYPGISDEHYWNLVVAHAVATLGQQRGLKIQFYKPPVRTIVDADDQGTNWSTGRQFAAAGGYALEIHFDAYGSAGVGSGLIPPLHRPFSRIDEALAQEFGAYPMNFREMLGGPKRGIGLLEIGKLEGNLEASLRDPRTRQRTVQLIAWRIVNAIEAGMGRGSRSPLARNWPPLSPPPDAAGTGAPVRDLQANSAAE